MSEQEDEYLTSRHLINALAVNGVATVDTSHRVRTTQPGIRTVAVSLSGPIYGTIPLFGKDAPEVQMIALLQIEGAAMLIAHLQERYRAFGMGAALTAHVDQYRALVKESIREETSGSGSGCGHDHG